MNLYEWGCSVPWAITDEALTAMLAIAAREPFDSDELKQVMHGPKALALRDGQRRDDSASMRTIDGVARIAIDGPIYRYADYFTKYSGGITTEALAKDFQKALDDPTVGAIALIIDSPGGEATGINELAETIYAARGKKPIGAYIEGFGASAAYWIASAADIVTVDDSALVGSIGTVMGVPDPSKRIKYTIDFVSSQSPKKRVDPVSDDGRAYLQSMVDDMTEVFIAKVARNRRMNRDQVLAVEGGMRVGQHAVTAGLADRLGSEDMLIRELAAKAASRSPYTLPPARVPGGAPVRMEEPMDWKAFWNGMFGAAAEAEGTPIAQQLEQTAPRTVQISAEDMARIESSVTPLVPAQSAADDRTLALERQIAELQQERIKTQALAFADRAVAAQHAMPSEHAALVALYTHAAADDARDPWTTKSAGEAESRVALLEWDVGNRPPHSLTQELIAAGVQLGALPNTGDPKQLSAERADALLAMTPLGQTVLRARKARSN